MGSEQAHGRLRRPPRLGLGLTNGSGYYLSNPSAVYRHAAEAVAGDNAGQIRTFLCPKYHLAFLPCGEHHVVFTCTYPRRALHLIQQAACLYVAGSPVSIHIRHAAAHLWMEEGSESWSATTQVHRSLSYPCLSRSKIGECRHLSGLMSADTDGGPVGRPPPAHCYSCSLSSASHGGEAGRVWQL